MGGEVSQVVIPVLHLAGWDIYHSFFVVSYTFFDQGQI